MLSKLARVKVLDALENGLTLLTKHKAEVQPWEFTLAKIAFNVVAASVNGQRLTQLQIDQVREAIDAIEEAHTLPKARQKLGAILALDPELDDRLVVAIDRELTIIEGIADTADEADVRQRYDEVARKITPTDVAAQKRLAGIRKLMGWG